MEMEEIKRLFDDRFSHWNVYFDESGIATWVSMNNGNDFFEIQIVTHVGVGVSYRRNIEEIKFSGHDEAFRSLREALDYIERKVASKM
ncbi:hypothetical protein ACFSR7_05095 [Cohnella sp. GCM10020058]|uniref:hypothetical protein n=1 Tax=Cohnella sp. GCM10020058 TaxID=3317330 RepID=UPI00362B9253